MLIVVEGFRHVLLQDVVDLDDMPENLVSML
jgi:hypothetical protein